MVKGKIYFRADGSTTIGLGHLIRSLALAQMLSDHFTIIFCCAAIPASIKGKIRKLHFEFIAIENDAAFTALLFKGDVAVLDGYHFPEKLHADIKQKGCKLVCIDDLHEQVFLADLIINHAPGIYPSDYKALPETQFALGLDYVLLRPPFLQAARLNKKRAVAENIFVCFGGSDVKNFTATVITVLKEFRQFKKIYVVTGASYLFLDSLIPLIKEDKRIKHYKDIDEYEMSRLITDSSLAVVPCSSILLEVLACGVAAVSSMYADNQQFFYTRLKQAGVFADAGDFSAAGIKNAIDDSIKKKTELPKLIDGNSPKRLLSKFLKLHTHLRPAAAEDTLLLFSWANEALVRSNSIHTEPIVWETHVQWFQKRLQSATCFIYILEFRDIPAGQIRLDEEEAGNWFIDYSVDEQFRGFGFGKIIVELALEKLKGKNIMAAVKEKNIPSKKVFESLGFNTASRQVAPEGLISYSFYNK